MMKWKLFNALFLFAVLFGCRKKATPCLQSLEVEESSFKSYVNEISDSSDYNQWIFLPVNSCNSCLEHITEILQSSLEKNRPQNFSDLAVVQVGRGELQISRQTKIFKDPGRLFLRQPFGSESIAVFEARKNDSNSGLKMLPIDAHFLTGNKNWLIEWLNWEQSLYCE